MSNNIFLKRLRVFGEKGCDYEFDDGLNIFIGTNNTGKTSLIHLIDSLFGKSKLSTIPEILNFSTFVLGDFIINGKNFSIKRNIKENSDFLDVYEGHFENIKDLEVSKFVSYKPKIATKKYKTIGDFFFKELGFTTKKVKVTKTKNNFSNLSFRNLLNLILIPQDGYKKIQAKNFVTQELMKKSVFEILFDIQQSNVIDLELEKKEYSEKVSIINSEINVFKKLLTDEMRSIGNSDNITNLEKKLEKLEIDKKSYLKSVEKDYSSGELGSELRNLDEEIKILNDKYFELKNREEELNMLFNETELNLRKNRSLLNARKIFSEIPITKCPKCFNSLDENHSSNDNCNVCGKELKEFEESSEFSHNLFLLMNEKKEISSLINSIKIEQEKVLEVKNNKSILKLDLEKKLDDINSKIISPALKKIELINIEIGTIRENLGRALQNNILLNEEIKKLSEKKDMEEKINNIDSLLSENKSSSENTDLIFQNFKEIYSKILKEILNFSDTIDSYDECYIPNVISGEKIFEINSTEDLMRTKKNKLVLGYYTAVLEYSLKYDIPFPRILIFDVPRQDELDSNVFKKLILYWRDLNKKYPDMKYQIIVTGGEFPDRDDIRYNIIDEFNNIKESGNHTLENHFSIDYNYKKMSRKKF